MGNGQLDDRIFEVLGARPRKGVEGIELLREQIRIVRREEEKVRAKREDSRQHDISTAAKR